MSGRRVVKARPVAGALMVCGTSSDSGKTTVVAGLCRLLARQGISVAPFKAQNMALNSAVTVDGHEIGRAQYLQAQAAGVPAEVAMNPILLKPTGERASQVVVMGRAVGVMSAVEYHQAKAELFPLVLEALADLRSRFDVVLIEGAGSPAEINLLANDIVNLRLAEAADVSAIVIGDIDPGGVFASLYGTVAILPDNLRRMVAGFAINKLRGDPALLLDGTAQLEALSGLPTFGVIPMLPGLRLDPEDSLALNVAPEPNADAALDVAVIQLPHISNFTDIDPLHLEPDVAVRYVRSARELGRPDLVVVPGSKATVADLAWLRRRGLDRAITSLAESGRTTIVGVCAGYQMLGCSIDDDVEGKAGTVPGLGLLPVTTTFDHDKVLSRGTGRAFGLDFEGYQIHHGRVQPHSHLDGRELEGGEILGQGTHAAVQAQSSDAFVQADDAATQSFDAVAHAQAAKSGGEVWLELAGPASATTVDGIRVGGVYGTTLHGLFDDDKLRRRVLSDAAERADCTYQPGGPSVSEHRQSQLDRLADQLAISLDVEALMALIDQSTRRVNP